MANEEIIGSSSVGATERPFMFEGNHFKRWQQKMFFFLTLKKCAYVLKDPIPVVPDVPTDASASGTKEQPVNTNGQTVSAAEPDKGKATAEQLKEKALQIEKERQLWIDNDYVCKNYIINGLEDDLYDYYRTYDTASDVWEALSKKYDTEEAGAKKYAVSRYLKYQMVDERSVEVQSHELQKIAHEIITEDMPLHEQFQISVIIDKLPPRWKDFKNQLRHKTKEFSIEGLITRLRIEEESRKQVMKEEEKILVVSNNNKKKFGAALKPTGKPLKIQNQSHNQNRVKNGNPVRGHNARQHQQPPHRNDDVDPFYCFNCWKTGHMSKKCRNPKRPKSANLAHINVNVADEPYTCMITEINMVGGTDGWWIDTGATRHVCYDRAMFKTYTNAENKKVQMGNAHTSDVAGIGDVVLKFTSGKTLILKEVLHVPEMKKNLVSGFLLNKAGFNQTIGADMYTITKNGIFIGKGVPKSKRSESAYEILKKRQPNLSYLRTWGCLAYVRKPDPKRVKLASRAYECVFIGYAANSKAYRFYDLNEKVIIESNDADFYENKFPFKSRNSGATEQDNIPESSHVPVIPNAESNDEVETELRRSKRVRVAKDYGPDYAAYTLNEDPANLQEALSSKDADLWQEAINDEMDSLESNKTWHLVDFPPGCKPIGCKWILKKKLKPDGTVEKYKARLLAKGFRQRENIDFFDTFSPVTRITSIRVFISIATLYNLIVHQMDVKTAFLNGDLEEEIYMEQPEGFVIHGQETKVCKLDKSLYGLKQAPKQWHEKFDNLMVSNGFRLNESDNCIYYKCDGNICTIICLYVDDMLIFGSNLSAVNNVKSLLGNNFDMKDLGEASVILGIKITRSEKWISLDQSHYVEKILKKYGYFDCKPACTPYDPSVKLFKNIGDSVRQTEYASIIGSLRYATDCTRPDIAYVVGLLCRFTSRPSNEHWHAIERVMRYLKRTMNLGLHYQRFPAVLEGYSDADWNTLSDDSKATSGFIFSIAGGAVSWKSKKQTILAQSTMEYEMIALATASEEASWLRCLLSEIPLWEKPMPAVLIHCDSTAAIAKTENRFYNGKRRQIRRKHSTVRELITTGAVRVDHVRTNDNLADSLTKGLAREKVQNTSYIKITVDRITYMNVELRPVPLEFRGEFLEHSRNWDSRAGPLMHGPKNTP
ncbi:hypothetical protein TSUD_408340 [Trifolium subterraneum]|uniref:CCHC-type domain-containing protein n=1 Tax=Trifolium subterraneum TaxID=3900 RepID=A0A2Z6PHW1_TRISU|nr:hypothetical protein TSUD_408340 [Trifolium subterraneum]